MGIGAAGCSAKEDLVQVTLTPAALANIMGNEESAFSTRLKRLISKVMKENRQNENNRIIPE